MEAGRGREVDRQAYTTEKAVHDQGQERGTQDWDRSRAQGTKAAAIQDATVPSQLATVTATCHLGTPTNNAYLFYLEISLQYDIPVLSAPSLRPWPLTIRTGEKLRKW